jgi:sugar lactone lactonase YvrE
MIPQLILDSRAILGEGPRWHDGEQRLYWVDIGRNTLHRFDPLTGRDEVRTFDAPVGCFAFRKAGGLLLAMADGCATIDAFDAPVVAFGEQVLAGRPDLRLNDGRVDPAGRFWVGSVNTAKSAHDAALYRVDPDGKVTEIEGGMLTANGAAFSLDGTRFHHADTPTHALRAYNVADGALFNRRILHQFVQDTGRPDGGSFDVDGCYWTALFDGGRVARLSPDGALLQEIALPCTRPTMIAFGGPDLRTAFVTTARVGLDDAALAAQPQAGGLFSFPVETPGVPEWRFG